MNHIATIWMSPEATIRDILDTQPGKLFFPLAATAGIATNLSQVIQRKVDLSSDITVLEILVVNFIVGALYGIVLFFVSSYVLTGLGRLFGGSPSSRAARTVLAWASVPYIPILVLIVLFLLVAGDNLVYYSMDELFRGVGGGFLQLAGLIYFLVSSILAIWSIVIAVNGLSEAFAISRGKSFIILLLLLIIFVAVMIGGIAVLTTI